MKTKELNITSSIICYTNSYIGGFVEEQVILRKIGGSLAVTIPKDIVNKLNLKENEKINIVVNKSKKSYFGAYSGKAPEFTEGDRIDSRID